MSPVETEAGTEALPAAPTTLVTPPPSSPHSLRDPGTPLSSPTPTLAPPVGRVKFSSVDFFSSLQFPHLESPRGEGEDGVFPDDGDREGSKEVERFPVLPRSMSPVGFTDMDFEGRGRGRRRRRKRSLCSCWCFRALRSQFAIMLFFLFVLGLSSSLTLLVMDYAIEYLYLLRIWISDHAGHQFLQFIVWLLPAVGLCFLATLVVQKISTSCIGSGIPEMKSVLSGIILENFLTFRTLLAKVLGLTLAIGGGLIVGKEGPAVHISAAIANNLMRFRCFRKVRKNQFLYLQMLAAACAVGVSANFGAPIGGVLFSVEVTATYYLVSNLWKGIFSAACGAVFFFGIRGLVSSNITHLFSTQFGAIPYDFQELLLFAMLGALCGLIGAAWNAMVEFFMKTRMRVSFLKTARHWTVFLMAVVTSIVTFFPGRYLKESPTRSLEQLISVNSLPSMWDAPNVYFCLCLYVFFKFFLTSISVTLPIPAGVFAPNLHLGALVGRLFGEIAAAIFPNAGILPGGYALVATAAMTTGVTRTLSTAVIIFELTGEISHMIPVLVAVLAALGVGNLCNRSVFDIILKLRKLPYFQEVSNPKNLNLLASDVMRRELVVFPQKTTMNEVLEVLQSHQMNSYPIVNNRNDMVLLGSVSRSLLEREVGGLQRLLEKEKKRSAGQKRDSGSGDLSRGTEASLSGMIPTVEPVSVEYAGLNPQVTFVNSLFERSGSNTRQLHSASFSNLHPYKDEGNTLHVMASPSSTSTPPLSRQPTLEGASSATLAPGLPQSGMPVEMSVFSSSGHPDDGVESLVSEGVYSRRRRQSVVPTRNDMQSVLEDRTLWIDFDPSPFTFPALASMSKIHFFFTMLGVSHGYVITNRGVLVGVISKKDLIEREL